MSMQDPISNLLAGINNAQARMKVDLVVPSSSKKISLLKVLEGKVTLLPLLSKRGRKKKYLSPLNILKVNQPSES